MYFEKNDDRNSKRKYFSKWRRYSISTKVVKVLPRSKWLIAWIGHLNQHLSHTNCWLVLWISFLGSFCRVREVNRLSQDGMWLTLILIDGFVTELWWRSWRKWSHRTSASQLLVYINSDFFHCFCPPLLDHTGRHSVLHSSRCHGHQICFGFRSDTEGNFTEH